MMTPRHALAAFSCLAILTPLPAFAQTAAPADGDVSAPAAITQTAPLPAEALATIPTATAPALIIDDEQPSAEPTPVAIPTNDRVANYVAAFTTSRRKFLQDALNRGARYLPMIQSIFRDEGLPEDLIYLPLIESAFRSGAVSHAGATGIWQLMRTTATFNGLSRDWYVDERLDPEKSTRAAARLLKTLYGMFGDWHLSLAAYNAGAGRVQQAMKRSERDSFWDMLDARKRYLPKETQEYVPLFLAALQIAHDPVAYGLNVSGLVEQPLYDVVMLTRPVDLRRAADWLGTTVDALKDLNPELRRWTTPVRAAAYALKVPAGLGGVLEARMADGSPSDLSQHVVKKGETLLSIAKKLNVTRADLAEANYLPLTAKLKIGDTLIVPRAPDSLRPTVSTTLASNKPAESVASLWDAPGRAKLVHLVRPGDTVDSIARAYRTTAAALREWNGLLANSLVPGQELTIFASTAP
jgi:membrane-bound lytic murein transglycosylase D